MGADESTICRAQGHGFARMVSVQAQTLPAIGLPIDIKVPGGTTAQ